MRIACLAMAALCLQEGSKEALKTALKDADIPASWIYDDLNAGFAEARKTGKPMLVVFR